jgi:hypothetical protein
MFGTLLFLEEQLIQLQLVEGLQLLRESPAVMDPLTDGVFEEARNVKQNALSMVANSQI